MRADNFINRFLYKEEGVLNPRGFRFLFLTVTCLDAFILVYLLSALWFLYLFGLTDNDKFLTLSGTVVLFLIPEILIRRFVQSHIFRLSDFEGIIRDSGGAFVSRSGHKYRNIIRFNKTLFYAKMGLRFFPIMYWVELGPDLQFDNFRKKFEYIFPTLFSKVEEENPLTAAYDLDWYGFVIPGDFKSLPKVTFGVLRNKLFTQTGNEVFDNAFSKLIQSIGDKRPDYYIEIKDGYIRASFWGSATQGRILGERIVRSIDLFEKFAEELSSHFSLYDIEKVSIDMKYGFDYEVRRIEPSEQTSTG